MEVGGIDVRYTAEEYQVVKGGAIKYALDHLVVPRFNEEFHNPIKEWVLAGPEEIRVVGGKKLWIQRAKAKPYTDKAKVAPDFMVLVKGGQLTKEDLVGLLETGAIAIANPDAVAKLCVSRLGQQESKYQSTTEEGKPALRWPTKAGIQSWFYALKMIADIPLQITKAAKTKAVKTMDKLLAQE